MNAPLSHYWAYLRPRTFPVTFPMALTGYALSPARASGLEMASELLLLFIVHSVLLWGGANAFNSAEDQDTEPVNLLPDPPPMPPNLGRFGVICMLAAIPLAAIRGWRPAVLVAIAVLLSVWYSWKRPGGRRAKEIGGIDNLIYAAGCGLGSIGLGYTLTPAALTPTVLLIGVAFSLAIFGGCPTSQIFQLRPTDTYASARNYASLLGPARTLQVGAIFFGLHVVMLWAVASPGWSVLAAVPLRAGLWAGWAVLVAVGAGHSLWWSQHPFEDAYNRMSRQLGVLMLSQIVWTVDAWIGSAS